MAVDYFHRLVVAGPRGTVERFRNELRQTVRRSIGTYKWRETIPFSFARLYEVAPAAVRIFKDVPRSPYDMSVWPIRQLPGRRAEVRYKFHTRSLEMLPYVRVLSREFSALTFVLVISCTDDGSTDSYRVCSGRVRTWILPEARHAVHWERARQEFKLTGVNVYKNDRARSSSEEGMREEALAHWERGTGAPRRRADCWDNLRVSRDLETERGILMAEFSSSLAAE